MKTWWLFVLLLMSVVPASAQDHLLCSTTPPPPFTVTSGSPFTISWVVPDTASENGLTVPNRFNGFYVQIDGGAKVDVGLAVASPACSASSVRPGDLPFTYKTTAGVARGSHTLKVSAWNFTLDGAGNPTTTKQESVVTSVPFAAGDPILFGPPMPPNPVIITK